MTPEERAAMVEKVAALIAESAGYAWGDVCDPQCLGQPEAFLKSAQAALAIAEPIIRANERERCAKIVEPKPLRTVSERTAKGAELNRLRRHVNGLRKSLASAIEAME